MLRNSRLTLFFIVCLEFLSPLPVHEIALYDINYLWIPKSNHFLYRSYCIVNSHVLPHLYTIYSFPNFHFDHEQYPDVFNKILFAFFITLLDGKLFDILCCGLIPPADRVYVSDLSWFLHSLYMLQVLLGGLDLRVFRQWFCTESLISCVLRLSILLTLINSHTIAFYLFIGRLIWFILFGRWWTVVVTRLTYLLWFWVDSRLEWTWLELCLYFF